MKDGKMILFIGDSITEDGRFEDEAGIGRGYVNLIHSYLTATYPDKKLQIKNRGVGGDRMTDLAARWKEDVIDLQPDIVSISIGVNDVWRQLDNPTGDQVYPEKFEQLYDAILTDTKKETKAKIIMMEPTVVTEDPEAEGNQKLKPYIEIIHRLAEKHQAQLVPTHAAFLTSLKDEKNKSLTTDGVHMNTAGSILMAETWLQTVGQTVREYIE